MTPSKQIEIKLGSVDKRAFGGKFELLAADYLQQNGCRIVETNYGCRLGEIDIILQDKQTLVFLEVRYRKRTAFGGAILSVDNKKQHKIVRTAKFYLQSKKLTNKIDCRFDVFAIQGPLDNFEYEWIKAAFIA